MRATWLASWTVQNSRDDSGKSRIASFPDAIIRMKIGLWRQSDVDGVRMGWKRNLEMGIIYTVVDGGGCKMSRAAMQA